MQPAKNCTVSLTLYRLLVSASFSVSRFSLCCTYFRKKNIWNRPKKVSLSLVGSASNFYLSMISVLFQFHIGRSLLLFQDVTECTRQSWEFIYTSSHYITCYLSGCVQFFREVRPARGSCRPGGILKPQPCCKLHHWAGQIVCACFICWVSFVAWSLLIALLHLMVSLLICRSLPSTEGW